MNKHDSKDVQIEIFNKNIKVDVQITIDFNLYEPSDYQKTNLMGAAVVGMREAQKQLRGLISGTLAEYDINESEWSVNEKGENK